MLNTPGLSTEIKARGVVSLEGTLRQAESRMEPGEMAVVVWRHNGQGEKQIDNWTATVRLTTFEKLLALLVGEENDNTGEG